MKKANRLALLALGLAALLLVAGCSFSSLTGTQSSTGTLSLYMTDAATNELSEVNVTITEVQVHRDGKWEILNTFEDGYSVNLLDLRFDETLLGTASLPAGAYTQIRLIVDDSSIALSNIVDADGTTAYLKVPSGAQTGLKIHHNFTVPAGGTVALTMDVNVLDFVHVTGTGDWIMNPSAIRVVDKVASGSIAGRVLDQATESPIADRPVTVTLRVDEDGDGQPDDVDGDGLYSPDTDYVAQTVALDADSTDESGATRLAGEFQLNAVPVLSEGSYLIEVTATDYLPWTSGGLQVAAGETTQVDGDPATLDIVDPILIEAATVTGT